jgi:uncharacterized protein (DUF58 family)
MRPTEQPPEAQPLAAQRLLQHLEWTALKRLDGLLQGDYRTFLRGQGLDLCDLREYQTQDDVRHIDWNVTARLQATHVRVFTEDREMVVWMLVDCSGSMHFGSGAQTKADLAQQLVAVLGRLWGRHGNRLGGLLFDGLAPPQVLSPRSGRLQVLSLLHALINRRSPAVTPHYQPSALAQGLKGALGVARQRSTVLVVSDFLGPSDWTAPLSHLALRHDVVVLRLQDPLERQLPDLGQVTLCDAETGEQMWVDTHDRAFRQRFARAALQRESLLRQQWAAAGVDALGISTEDDLVDSLLRYLELRRRRPLSARRAAA